jgi:hypothetical protein
MAVLVVGAGEVAPSTWGFGGITPQEHFSSLGALGAFWCAEFTFVNFNQIINFKNSKI